MQVMQTSELSKTEVLVGQAQQTQNFSVSDDPMLMSMLSTGFYGNPLRTMIQEVMFNAWDAHRMGNCLDRPIDVYINKESGLIIRDYGPGIADEDMHSVYCVYGGSTKRKDKRLTGGFGLGSKSPFAYAESFTVTSMNDGTRSLYLISRVSEDGGKPGMTRLMQNPVINDSGLMVTVNLEDGDHTSAFGYIKDILFLSGVKARIHYFDEEPELIESQALAAGEYHADIENTAGRQRGIYAVYGGVRYQIPRHKDYEEEYSALYSLCNNTCLYIGFAPDTLTPLPNREGLNMSEKSREAVKIGFELCLERFREAVEPLVSSYMAHMFKAMADDGVQPHFALNASFTFSHPATHGMDRVKFIEEAMDKCPEGVIQNIWDLGLQLLRRFPKSLVEALGDKRWFNLLLVHFLKAYPTQAALVSELRKSGLHHHIGMLSTQVERTIIRATMPGFYREIFEIERHVAAIYPKDDLLRVTLYAEDCDVWQKVSHEKFRTHVSWKGSTKQTFKSPAQVYPDRLFFHKSGDEMEHLFMTKVIYMGKTLSALRDTSVNWGRQFSTKIRNTREFGSMNSTKVLGCVVHSRNGAYEEAKKAFESRGWIVIEADEPLKKERTVATGKPSEPEYPRMVAGPKEWADYDTMVSDPTHYFYMTISELNSPYSWNSHKPDVQMVQRISELFPKTVMIHNRSTADALVKRGVKPFTEAVETWFNSMIHKKYRFRNMVRAMKILEISDLRQSILQESPFIQKTFGMVPVKPDEATSFWRDVKDYSLIVGTGYHDLRTLSVKAKTSVDETWNADPLASKIRKISIATKIFNEYALESQWKKLVGQDRVDFEEKFARFIRVD